MKRLTWIFAASAMLLAPAVARSDNNKPDPWASTKPDQTQQQDQTMTNSRARLGVRVMDLTSDLRQYFAAPSGQGLLIAKVDQGTAAARAGLMAGDVLVSVQGQTIASASDVRDALSNVNPGDKVQLQLIRDKKPITLTATITNDQTSQLDWMRDVMPWFDPDKLETPT